MSAGGSPIAPGGRQSSRTNRSTERHLPPGRAGHAEGTPCPCPTCRRRRPVTSAPDRSEAPRRVRARAAHGGCAERAADPRQRSTGAAAILRGGARSGRVIHPLRTATASPYHRGVSGGVTSPVLINRVAEMRRLVAAWDDARAGRPRFVLVTGEAGIGKSRLLIEGERILESQGADRLVGAGLSPRDGMPQSAVAPGPPRPVAALG